MWDEECDECTFRVYLSACPLLLLVSAHRIHKFSGYPWVSIPGCFCLFQIPKVNLSGLFTMQRVLTVASARDEIGHPKIATSVALALKPEVP